jgi:two-component system chemotaxis response regulator CheB
MQLTAASAPIAHNQPKRVRLMIIDDSSSVRRVLERMLADRDGIEIVASVGDAQQAISQIPTIKPDVISLDVEMPGLGGIEALQRIMRVDPDARVIMLSTLTLKGSKVTSDAMRLGAMDVLVKPGLGVSPSEFKMALCAKVMSVRHR